MNSRKRILIFIGWFDPGFKGGGSLRSCVNFVGHMKDVYEIFIFTRDRDLGSSSAYEGIIFNDWIDYTKGVKILYASPSYLNWINIERTIKNVQPFYIYINSMFDKYFSVYPMLMKRVGRIPGKLVVAPRGMLKQSALRFTPAKKRLFLSLLKLAQVGKYVSFHATDETEVLDINKNIGSYCDVTCIPNLSGVQNRFIEPPLKNINELRMIFVGRIHPIKNLNYLLQCLAEIKSSVQLTIVATIEDKLYWQECQKVIAQLPANITATMAGDLPHKKIEGLLVNHHVFALLTRGENFGHAIFEALSAGRPVLISDQTPWRNLEPQRVGWDIALADKDRIIRSIEQAAVMNHNEITTWCRSAWQYCNNYIQNSGIKEQYVKMFK